MHRLVVWLWVIWDVLSSYPKDWWLRWRRRRALLPSTPLSEWSRDPDRRWPARGGGMYAE